MRKWKATERPTTADLQTQVNIPCSEAQAQHVARWKSIRKRQSTSQIRVEALPAHGHPLHLLRSCVLVPHQAFIQMSIPPRLPLQRILLFHNRPAPLPPLLACRVVGKGLLDGLTERPHVVRFCQPARFAGAHHVGNAAGVEAHDGRAAGHGFEHGVGEIVLPGRDDEQVGEAVEDRQQQVALNGAEAKWENTVAISQSSPLTDRKICELGVELNRRLQALKAR